MDAKCVIHSINIKNLPGSTLFGTGIIDISEKQDGSKTIPTRLRFDNLKLVTYFKFRNPEETNLEHFKSYFRLHEFVSSSYKVSLVKSKSLKEWSDKQTNTVELEIYDLSLIYRLKNFVSAADGSQWIILNYNDKTNPFKNNSSLLQELIISNDLPISYWFKTKIVMISALNGTDLNTVEVKTASGEITSNNKAYYNYCIENNVCVFGRTSVPEIIRLESVKFLNADLTPNAEILLPSKEPKPNFNIMFWDIETCNLENNLVPFARDHGSEKKCLNLCISVVIAETKADSVKKVYNISLFDYDYKFDTVKYRHVFGGVPKEGAKKNEKGQIDPNDLIFPEEEIVVEKIICKDQLEMMFSFAMLIRKNKPAFISGFNCLGYDWRFIYDTLLNIADAISKKRGTNINLERVRLLTNFYLICDYYVDNQNIEKHMCYEDMITYMPYDITVTSPYFYSDVRIVDENSKYQNILNIFRRCADTDPSELKITADLKHIIHIEINIPGIIIIDTCFILKKNFPNINKNSLESFLNLMKLQGKEEFETKSISKVFASQVNYIKNENGLETFDLNCNLETRKFNDLPFDYWFSYLCKYCNYDSLRLKQLWDKTGVIDDLLFFSRMNNTNIQTNFYRASSTKIDNCIRLFLPKNFFVDFTKIVPRDKEFEGAYVVEITENLVKLPVGTIDFASLYPSIMEEYGLCPTTTVRLDLSNYAHREWLKKFFVVDHNLLTGIEYQELPRAVGGPIKRPVNLDYDFEKDIPYLHYYAGTDEQLKKEFETKDILFRLTDNIYTRTSDQLEPPHIQYFTLIHKNDKNKYGLVPRLLSMLKEVRKSVKEQMGVAARIEDWASHKSLDARQAIVKQFMNSFYGLMGADPSFSLLSSPILARCITKLGQLHLKYTRALVMSKYPLEVIYGDTDSLFLKFMKKFYDEIKKDEYLSKVDKSLKDEELAKATTAALEEYHFAVITKANENYVKVSRTVNSQYSLIYANTILKVEYERLMYPIWLQKKKKYCGLQYDEPEKGIKALMKLIPKNIYLKGKEKRFKSAVVDHYLYKLLFDMLDLDNPMSMMEIALKNINYYKATALEKFSPKDFCIEKTIKRHGKSKEGVIQPIKGVMAKILERYNDYNLQEGDVRTFYPCIRSICYPTNANKTNNLIIDVDFDPSKYQIDIADFFNKTLAKYFDLLFITSKVKHEMLFGSYLGLKRNNITFIEQGEQYVDKNALNVFGYQHISANEFRVYFIKAGNTPSSTIKLEAPPTDFGEDEDDGREVELLVTEGDITVHVDENYKAFFGVKPDKFTIKSEDISGWKKSINDKLKAYSKSEIAKQFGGLTKISTWCKSIYDQLIKPEMQKSILNKFCLGNSYQLLIYFESLFTTSTQKEKEKESKFKGLNVKVVTLTSFKNCICDFLMQCKICNMLPKMVMQSQSTIGTVVGQSTLQSLALLEPSACLERIQRVKARNIESEIMKTFHEELTKKYPDTLVNVLKDDYDVNINMFKLYRNFINNRSIETIKYYNESSIKGHESIKAFSLPFAASIVDF
jgi:DNA polymerase elongation subunit (family B)